MNTKKLLSALLEYGMLENQRGVLVAYSGGADSTALLYLMNELCREREIYIHALHVHHGIRGAEADRDADFCRTVCEGLNIDFTLECADIPSLAKQSGRGIEETARAFRYETFVKAVEADERLTCVATAHNADDNAETVIFNLTRGSGTAGLSGIPRIRTVSGIPVIRPLLHAAKRDILGYLEENGIDYIFDSTNNDTAYTRNYIRHEIMPRLERVNPSFLTGFKRMTENLRSDSDYLDGVARQFISEHAPGGKISVRRLAQAHRAVAARVLCMLYSRISAGMLERVHIDALLSLAKSAQNGASASLPDGVRAFVADGELCFTDEPSESPITFEYPIHEGANRFDKLGFAIFVVKRGDMCSDLQKDNETLQNIYKLSIHTILSSDKIKHMLFVRQRRDGDAYVFGGMTRKLKKLYNDRKWSHKKRRGTPILCDGDGIVWVPEFPSADRMKGQGDVEITYYYNGD